MKLLSTLALLALATPAMAQDKMTLMLDWFVNPDHGPIIVAQEKGYFADNGLEVEVIAPADPSDPPKMVAAGSADLAISYQPQLHLQIHEGLPLKRVGTLVATPLNCLLTLKDGPIASPADLKGKKVGFSVGGVEEAVVGSILKTYDLTMDDVEMVNVNWSLSPALMSGQVDAVIGAYRNFELNQMDIEGTPGKCFYVEEEGLPAYDELIYVANPQTMDKDKIARF
ncbi:ABC transporter substrate-binding protein, partial [Brevirhabdus sp.]|uniref:ABC transporter substrate-binding protein n=1 Tax=Brevirhabdus sp. TaxID=2004514 RepID=UPI004059A004